MIAVSVKNSIIALAIGVLFSLGASAQEIIIGADRFIEYVPLLANKRVAIVANHTTNTQNGDHLVDVLHKAKINVVKVFSPEHGFRGEASAGDHVSHDTDAATGIPLISLYGDHRKPNFKMLLGVDVVIFDIQDVGTRFYTYISTLGLVMEACAENYIPIIVLDRPNPNGHYVDGPTLQQGYQSFVGKNKIPVVYGMTVGEYATMINEELWLSDSVYCQLKVVPVTGYAHDMVFALPVPPSPNLPNAEAVRLYPSLCFFEGTTVSVGRGTKKPFQQIGAPYMKKEFANYSFVPRPNAASTSPPYNGDTCFGIDLTPFAKNFLTSYNQIYLYWLIESYNIAKSQGLDSAFFTPFFDKLAGSSALREQIIAGKTEEEIRESWQADIIAFKKLRRNYLLYPDFE